MLILPDYDAGSPGKYSQAIYAQFQQFHPKRFITASAPTKTCNLLQKMSRVSAFVRQVNIYNFPFTVSRQDRIVLHRLKDVKIGDILRLDRIREIGSHFHDKGRPGQSRVLQRGSVCDWTWSRGKVKAKEPKRGKGIRKNLDD